MSKLSDALREKNSKGVEFDKSTKPFPIGVFVFSCLYFLVAFIGRFNFLVVVSVAFSMAIGIIILFSAIFTNRISMWHLYSYSVFLFGAVFTYIVFGADPFWQRLGYNLLISSLSIAAIILIYFVTKIFKINAQYLAMASLSVVLIGSSFLYFFTMSIRLRPTAQSLKEGHDAYLDAIAKQKNDNGAPNVLIILMDDMGFSDISSYSYLGEENATIKTPNIDKIGEDGVMFTDFYACSPVCSPSRFGMLTGRYSARGYLDNVIFPTCVSLDPFGSTRYFNPFQFVKNVDGILGDEITFAEALGANGYRSGIFGKWNLGDYGEYLPTNQGFDYFFGSYYVNDMTPYNMVREQNGVSEEVYSHYDIIDQSESTKHLTEELNNYITDCIDNNDKFLAYYTTPWPHAPIFSGVKGDTTDDNYIKCIEEFDTYLGTTLDLLREKGVYDDTLIIFTSDNGPGKEGATGALKGRKNTTFEGGQKVPMLVSYPNGGVGRGSYFDSTEKYKKITSSTMNIDIFPTLLRYCGVNVLPQDRVIDGVDLYDLLQGNIDPATRVHDALYYLKRGKVQAVQMPATINVDGADKIYDFKYFDKVRNENSAFIDQMYRNYLFNLDIDPIEGYNISMTYPTVAETLNIQLGDFRQELKDNRRGIVKEYYNN